MRDAPLSIAICYHFFPPDDVVSAVLYGDLSSGLQDRGWSVSVYSCPWNCHHKHVRHPASEIWKGIRVQRHWRPNFNQSSPVGRLANSAWMIARWSMLALHPRSRPDILLIGTDPVLALLIAPVWNKLSPKTRIAQWCFDLYPEAAIADGLMSCDGWTVKVLKRLLKSAYRACSLIADVGPCMRRLLLLYPSTAERQTLTPWALDEPETPLPIYGPERTRLFGEVRLALLYSGSFGRAHSYADLLSLAERLNNRGALLVFSVRGNREAELKEAARIKRSPVRFVPFAPEERLRERLACADVHVVSLEPGWTGTVLPSKFFGALAAGRPVLFAGSSASSIADWIVRHQVGWVLNSENSERIAEALVEYSHSPHQQAKMQQRCWNVYQANFSRVVQVDRWDRELRAILSGPSHVEK